MQNFFFSKRHTDLDADIKERAERLKVQWEALLRDRRQVQSKLGQYLPDTLSAELARQDLHEQEDNYEKREADIVREDRLLEKDSLVRGLDRVDPADPNGPRIREKLLGRIKTLEELSVLP